MTLLQCIRKIKTKEFLINSRRNHSVKTICTMNPPEHKNKKDIDVYLIIWISICWCKSNARSVKFYKSISFHVFISTCILRNVLCINIYSVHFLSCKHCFCSKIFPFMQINLHILSTSVYACLPLICFTNLCFR